MTGCRIFRGAIVLQGSAICGSLDLIGSSAPMPSKRARLNVCLGVSALRWRSPIFAFKNGTAPHHNSFELGQHGRYRTNVWQYRGVNTLKAGRMDELELHPTVKPVAMIADAIKDVSERNAIVLDAFGGSGSTLVAAHKTGRRGYLIELDPI